MKPGKIRFATHALAAPADWDAEKYGECDPLQVRKRADGIMESAWYPSTDELTLLAMGRPVILSIWGDVHPPVSVNVTTDESDGA
jgi:hypothetical protein